MSSPIILPFQRWSGQVCSSCHKETTVQEKAHYGSRCEDCYVSNGLIENPRCLKYVGDPRMISNQIVDWELRRRQK